jgi:hypothetical protein
MSEQIKNTILQIAENNQKIYDKIPTEPMADWGQTDPSAVDYIKNKIPVENGDGAKSIVIGTGDANG